MKRFTAGTVGRGKSIHAVHAHGAHQGETVCGKTAMTLVDGEAAISCKSCRSALASWSVMLTAEEIAELQPTESPEVEQAHVEALEVAEIIAFEQAMYDLFRSEGWGSQDALDMTESCRNLDSEWSESTAQTKRYDELLRRYGCAAPFVVRTS